MPADSRASRIAAASSADSTLSLAPSANCASASDRASPILRSAARSLRCATDSSIILAMKIVQVTSEAKARPTITALTMMSADMNIDHGDNSCSAATVDFSALPSAGSALYRTLRRRRQAGSRRCGAGAGAARSCGRRGCNARRASTGLRRRLRRRPFCCANDGCASDSIASASMTTQSHETVLKQ